MPKDCWIRFSIIPRVTAFCFIALLSGSVFALPSGGQVTNGSGQISQNGKDMTVDQNTQNLVINWQTFNIDNGESVVFHQPNSSSVALNRVTTQNASEILGNLSSNGQVFIINPNGVIFGKNAQVRVGALLASTRDISDKDFLSKNYTFSGLSNAGIVNNGDIDVSNGGYVALLGASVTNNGTVKASNGNVSMAAGKQITLQLNNNSLLGLTVDQGELKAAVHNHGLIQAQDGKIYLTAKAADDLTSAVVNNDGEIDADSLNADGGVIRLVAVGGTTTTSGKISATGAHGGSVQVLADQHAGVMGGSIDVSGKNGGGSIRVGGGAHGNEKNIQNSDVSYIAKNATLNADATDQGDGGSVVVFGNHGNNFFGNISARGGKNGGKGGFVETSAHSGLNINGHVDVSSENGAGGTWLLDPSFNVTIDAAGGTAFANPFTAAADSNIAVADINTALDAGGNVLVFTGSGGTGNITIDSTVNVVNPLAKIAGAASTLYLEASGSITDNGVITPTSTNALNLNFWANYGAASASTTYSAGACTTCDVTFSGATITSIGNIDVRASRNVLFQSTSTISIGSADTLSITTTGGAVTESTNSALLAGTLSGSATGAVSLTSTANAITTLNGFAASGFDFIDSFPLTIRSAVGGTGADTTIQSAATGSGSGITLASGSVISGRNITIANGGAAFTNNAGSGVFSLGSGRWLVYSQNPGDDTLGGLSSNFTQYNITYPTAPTGTGNGLLYTSAAPPQKLSFLSNQQTPTQQQKLAVIRNNARHVIAPVNPPAPLKLNDVKKLTNTKLQGLSKQQLIELILQKLPGVTVKQLQGLTKQQLIQQLEKLQNNNSVLTTDNKVVEKAKAIKDAKAKAKEAQRALKKAKAAKAKKGKSSRWRKARVEKEKAKAEAAAKARLVAEEKAKADAAENAATEEKAKAVAKTEEKARVEAEEKTTVAAEEKVKAEEKERLAAEEKAKAEKAKAVENAEAILKEAQRKLKEAQLDYQTALKDVTDKAKGNPMAEYAEQRKSKVYSPASEKQHRAEQLVISAQNVVSSLKAPEGSEEAKKLDERKQTLRLNEASFNQVSEQYNTAKAEAEKQKN